MTDESTPLREIVERVGHSSCVPYHPKQTPTRSASPSTASTPLPDLTATRRSTRDSTLATHWDGFSLHARWAVAARDRVLLLDEPTSALDPAATASVVAVIADLRRRGFTQALVTHDPDLGRSLADQLVQLG